jgi:acyl CoA:acetate/3-ketoacid CoA transferase
MDAGAAAELVPDDATVAITGAGGGLVEPEALMAAIEARFHASGSPHALTIVHALGIGDRERRGLNHFAFEGMTRRVIGGHWVWSPAMQRLAREEKIEAYVLPGGVISQLMREIGAGRPGLFTHVGLGTFVDPRLDGGRMNASARDELVEVVTFDGRELLRYKPFPVDIAIVRGSFADPEGNVSLDQEGANLDAWAVALAAKNSGGRVLVQVREMVAPGRLAARSIRIPSALVDAVVVVPEQRQSYAVDYDPSLSGEKRHALPDDTEAEFSSRQAIARRAAAELWDGAVINFGFGIPDAVAKLIAARGEVDRYYQTIEHGTYGGALLDGVLFGFARNASAMLDSPSQFDFYGGGGLDIAFLGMGELDGAGNVNASKLGGDTVGPGGFIDIAQNARKVVFCGTFEAKGAKIATGDGRLTVKRPGEVRKLVDEVAQITFSGAQALKGGQEAIYVTERAVFRLRPDGLVLAEIAPGVDLERDVLGRMAFRPLMPAEPEIMAADLFTA